MRATCGPDAGPEQGSMLSLHSAARCWPHADQGHAPCADRAGRSCQRAARQWRWRASS